MQNSEFNTPPSKIIIHHPRIFGALSKVDETTLSKYSFFEAPDSETLYAQYDQFIATINDLGVPTIELVELFPESERKSLNGDDPNLMFTRDSAITLPWAKDAFIVPALYLPSRVNEAQVMKSALSSLGLKPVLELEPGEHVEGGDILPVVLEGKRTLVVGLGHRTSAGTVTVMAHGLIPEYADQIIGLWHDPDVLHLDTGFTILPNQTILVAEGMFSGGFIVGQDMEHRNIKDVEGFFKEHDFRFIIVDKQAARLNEHCNLLPLGNNNFLSFELPPELKRDIETTAGITIHEVEGSEIAKGEGGAHCLTRPVYL